MYILELNRLISATIVTWYRLSAVLNCWHGSKVDTGYSNLSKVLRVTALLPGVFRRSYSLVAYGEQIAYEAFVILSWYRTTEWSLSDARTSSHPY